MPAGSRNAIYERCFSAGCLCRPSIWLLQIASAGMTGGYAKKAVPLLSRIFRPDVNSQLHDITARADDRAKPEVVLERGRFAARSEGDEPGPRSLTIP